MKPLISPISPISTKFDKNIEINDNKSFDKETPRNRDNLTSSRKS